MIDKERCMYLMTEHGLWKFSPSGNVLWHYRTPGKSANEPYLTGDMLLSSTTEGTRLAKGNAILQLFGLLLLMMVMVVMTIAKMTTENASDDDEDEVDRMIRARFGLRARKRLRRRPAHRAGAVGHACGRRRWSGCCLPGGTRRSLRRCVQ